MTGFVGGCQYFEVLRVDQESPGELSSAAYDSKKAQIFNHDIKYGKVQGIQPANRPQFLASEHCPSSEQYLNQFVIGAFGNGYNSLKLV